MLSAVSFFHMVMVAASIRYPDKDAVSGGGRGAHCGTQRGAMLEVTFCGASLSSGEVQPSYLDKNGFRQKGREKPNQDSYALECSGPVCVFSAFDGHGEGSEEVSRNAAINISDLLEDKAEIMKSQLLEDTVEQIIEHIASQFRTDRFLYRGCTATGLFLNLDTAEIISFNVGDGRTLVWGKNDRLILETRDHDSSDQAHKDRVKQIGKPGESVTHDGEVERTSISWGEKYFYNLMPARTFGDSCLKVGDDPDNFIVMDKPDLVKQRLDGAPDDIYMFLAGSDGMYDSLYICHDYYFTSSCHYAHDKDTVNAGLLKNLKTSWKGNDLGEAVFLSVMKGSDSRWGDPKYRRPDDTTAIAGVIKVVTASAV